MVLWSGAVFLKKGFVLWLICLSVLLIRAHAASANNESVIVIANPTVDIDILNTIQLRNIFSMRLLTWPNGQKINVFVLNESIEAHKEFCTKILGVFPYQMERHWNKLAFSGLADLPILVKDEAELIL